MEFNFDPLELDRREFLVLTAGVGVLTSMPQNLLAKTDQNPVKKIATMQPEFDFAIYH